MVAGVRSIAFGADWRYLVVSDSDPDETPFEADYDDSAWPVGPAPFGATSVVGRLGADDWLPIGTSFATDQKVWMRAAIIAAVSVTFRYDSDLVVAWNSVVLTNLPGPSISTDPVLETTLPLPHETGVLAVLAFRNVRPGVDGSYVDASAQGGRTPIRQYPRDDGTGLSSAPRLYPPVKGDRLAGGYQ